jgi:hypothetical protein
MQYISIFPEWLITRIFCRIFFFSVCFHRIPRILLHCPPITSTSPKSLWISLYLHQILPYLLVHSWVLLHSLYLPQILLHLPGPFSDLPASSADLPLHLPQFPPHFILSPSDPPPAPLYLPSISLRCLSGIPLHFP